MATVPYATGSWLPKSLEDSWFFLFFFSTHSNYLFFTVFGRAYVSSVFLTSTFPIILQNFNKNGGKEITFLKRRSQNWRWIYFRCLFSRGSFYVGSLHCCILTVTSLSPESEEHFWVFLDFNIFFSPQLEMVWNVTTEHDERWLWMYVQYPAQEDALSL